MPTTNTQMPMTRYVVVEADDSLCHSVAPARDVVSIGSSAGREVAVVVSHGFGTITLERGWNGADMLDHAGLLDINLIGVTQPAGLRQEA